jgi:hypothetical protein
VRKSERDRKKEGKKERKKGRKKERKKEAKAGMKEGNEVKCECLLHNNIVVQITIHHNFIA